MCELMGMCFEKPVSADFSIREFAHRSGENPDGWGLGWYPDRSLALAKEPLSWVETRYTDFLETYHGVRSTLYIGHVRHKTVGGRPTHADTHPFVRELGGREYCFAHNGTLRGGFWRMPLGRFRPVGDTDSERLFCLLMAELTAWPDGLESEESWRWLGRWLSSMNGYGKLNCLLSDGRRLFAYHDHNGFKGLHHRRVRLLGKAQRHFQDREVEVEVEPESAGVDEGYVIASRPLSTNPWGSFRPGELIVFEAGARKYSSAGAATTSGADFASESGEGKPRGGGSQ